MQGDRNSADSLSDVDCDDYSDGQPAVPVVRSEHPNLWDASTTESSEDEGSYDSDNDQQCSSKTYGRLPTVLLCMSNPGCTEPNIIAMILLTPI